MSEYDKWKLLDAISVKPGMYLGHSPPTMRELRMIEFGYDLGSSKNYGTMQETCDGFFPKGFTEYICSRVPLDSVSFTGWSYRLEFGTETTEEAWKLFVELWKEFKTKYPRPKDEE